MKLNKFLLAVMVAAMMMCFPVYASDTYISGEYQGYCYEIGEAYNISPYILMAMIETESSGNRYAENGGCKGLMQIGTRWHRGRMKRLGVTDIYDARSNILVGADYLAELCEGNEGDISLSLDLYNGNSKAYSNARNGVTSRYVRKVLGRAAEITEYHDSLEEETNEEIIVEPAPGPASEVR